MMDAFEAEMDRLGKMDENQKKLETDRLRKECICPDCPTYTKCAGEKQELLYCLTGKSQNCITDELGCICPDCPVAAELEMINLYYCTQGSEADLRRS